MNHRFLRAIEALIDAKIQRHEVGAFDFARKDLDRARRRVLAAFNPKKKKTKS